MRRSCTALARHTVIFAILLGSAVMAMPVMSIAATTVAGYVLVSTVGSGPTSVDFTYQIKVHNGAPAISNTVATATSAVPDTVILDGTVWVGNAGVNTTVDPVATIVLRQTRGVALKLANLRWAFTTEMDPAARAQSLQDLTDEFKSLDGLNDADRNTALSTFVAARPEFASFGTAETDFWAKFTDGRVVLVIDNRGAAGTAPSSLAAAPMSQQATAQEPLPAFNRQPVPAGTPGAPVASTELPGSSAVRLMSAMGPNWQDVRSDVGNMLMAKAYNVTLVAGTVENLKAVGGDGVFYIGSHGGVWKRTAQDPVQVAPFALWTSTEHSSALDEAYDNELRLGRLVYMLAKTDRVLGNQEKHYGITAAFVERYWTAFARNSMVFIDACRSNGMEAPPFRDAILAKGATAYFGWDFAVDDDFAAATAQFMFDRMLGANLFRADSPPQRPFPWPDAQMDLANHGLTADSSGTKLVINTCTTCQAAFGLLAPSIQSSSLGSGALGGASFNLMFLSGLFGEDPGGAAFGGTQRRVTLGGTEIPIESPWEAAFVQVKPRATGAASVGPYFLTVRDHVSNGGMLSEWVGNFTTTVKGPGTINAKIIHRLRIRADYQASRTVIHGPPDFALSFGDLLGTRQSWSCGGTFQSGGNPPYTVYTWSGSKGSTQIPFNLEPGNMIVNLDAPPSLMLPFIPDAGSDNDCTVKTDVHKTDGTVETTTTPFSLSGFFTIHSDIDMLIDPASGALMGRKFTPVKVPGGFGPILVTVTQSFPDIPNNYPPDLTQGR
jgi:hypothetical protein